MENNNKGFKIVSEEEFEEGKKELENKLNSSMLDIEDERSYVFNKINWIETKDSWKELKEKTKDLINKKQKILFIGNSNQKIEGKAQLISETIQRIPLIRRVERIQDKILHIEYKFLDDRFDRRYNGNETDSLAFDFYTYRIVFKGKEYYILSESELSEEYSELHGVSMDLTDTTELSNSLKVKKITSVFIVKEAIPKVKILSRENLVEFTKSLKSKYNWDKKTFQDFIFLHPDGKIYDYSPEFNNLRIAQLLSSKYEGYPLHLLKVGKVGTGKTTEAEALDYKFREEQGIFEAGSSRIKGLIPSFKEKPCNLGYICRCNRIAILDELMKMVEEALSSSHDSSRVQNLLGQFNMLLEQKKRMVSSGNDNSAIVHSTAKVCISTNNLGGKDTIYEHLGILDVTTLSRMLIWVQNNQESEKIYSKEGIRTYNPANTYTSAKAFSRETLSNHTLSLDLVFAEELDDFLTIYDSCQRFLVKFNEEKCKTIFNSIVSLAKDRMKDVWKARGLHHTILILDGLVKFRCLFQDYDKTYTPKDEDYDLTERILVYMVKSWDTDFRNSNWEGSF